MTTDRATLTDRLRAALADEPSTREVRMFGGVSFMVRDTMVVAARGGGDLLVRVDPRRRRDLITYPGVEPAEMGNGRVMGPSWISVGADAVADDEHLRFWIKTALEYNNRAR